jgi:hypothetical protein
VALRHGGPNFRVPAAHGGREPPSSLRSCERVGAKRSGCNRTLPEPANNGLFSHREGAAPPVPDIPSPILTGYVRVPVPVRGHADRLREAAGLSKVRRLGIAPPEPVDPAGSRGMPLYAPVAEAGRARATRLWLMERVDDRPVRRPPPAFSAIARTPAPQQRRPAEESGLRSSEECRWATAAWPPAGSWP